MSVVYPVKYNITLGAVQCFWKHRVENMLCGIRYQCDKIKTKVQQML